MKKHILLLGLLLATGISAEDFITDFEYGQMLYRDPRGASCAACHGETGSGKLIGEYPDKTGRIVTLRGPDIRHATLQQIRNSVRKGAGVMPRYFLTEQEVKTIHAYLKKLNGHEKVGSIARLFERNTTTPTETNSSTQISDFVKSTE